MRLPRSSVNGSRVNPPLWEPAISPSRLPLFVAATGTSGSTACAKPQGVRSGSRRRGTAGVRLASPLARLSRRYGGRRDNNLNGPAALERPGPGRGGFSSHADRSEAAAAARTARARDLPAADAGRRGAVRVLLPRLVRPPALGHAQQPEGGAAGARRARLPRRPGRTGCALERQLRRLRRRLARAAAGPAAAEHLRLLRGLPAFAAEAALRPAPAAGDYRRRRRRPNRRAASGEALPRARRPAPARARTAVRGLDDQGHPRRARPDPRLRRPRRPDRVEPGAPP